MRQLMTKIRSDLDYVPHGGKGMVPRSAIGLRPRGDQMYDCSLQEAVTRHSIWPGDSENPFDIVGYACPSK